MKKSLKRSLVLSASIFIVILMTVSAAAPVEVIIVGDTQLKPVIDIISGIKWTMESPFKVYSPSHVKGKLRDIAEQEDTRLVIALGRDAVDEALRLPPSIPVIYDLVLTPPNVSRTNATGFYMATPVGRYIDLIKNYLPSLKRVAVVGSRDLTKVLDGTEYPQVISYNVKNSFEFVNKIKHLEGVDAILLLPDASLLTAGALEEIYLLSFKKGIPILGISEKHVKQGALLSLVFDPSDVGKQIGEKASKAMDGNFDLSTVPPSPSREFDLFVNANTARQMGIVLTADILRKAKRVYQ